MNDSGGGRPAKCARPAGDRFSCPARPDPAVTAPAAETRGAGDRPLTRRLGRIASRWGCVVLGALPALPAFAAVAGANPDFGLDRLPRGERVALTMTFAAGEARIPEEIRPSLQALARQHADAKLILCVTAAGTDARPPVTPATLGHARAAAVRDFLVAQGAEEKRLVIGDETAEDAASASQVTLRHTNIACQVSPATTGPSHRR